MRIFEKCHDLRVELDLSEFDDASDFVIDSFLGARRYYHSGRGGAEYVFASNKDVNFGKDSDRCRTMIQGTQWSFM